MKDQVAQHPMAVVTRRTGLRPDVIRAWERRHGAVRPARSAGNQRLYTDAEVRRLLLIRRALDAGWQIGQVGSLPDIEIEKLITEVGALPAPAPRDRVRVSPLEPFLLRCLERTADLDGEGLRRELESASVEFGRVQLLEGLLHPLMDRIGEACADGSLRIAHEHLATAAVRSFLDSVQGAYPVPETAPAIVITTPAYQHHELAAVIVAAAARGEAWLATYLGPNLPAEEIAAAVAKPGVRVLALSLTFDPADDSLDTELRKIGRMVPEHVSIVVGGRAAASYRGALDEIGALSMTDLGQFRDFLKSKRGRA